MLNKQACQTLGLEWSRRGFLRAATLATAAGTAAMLLPARNAEAAQIDVLLLSCMDYRLLDAIVSYMHHRGLKGKYDHIILAGGSLGAVTDKYPAWNETFWEHLDAAIALHGVKQVLLMDHRDCGAYRVILGEDLAKDPAKETASHTTELRKLREQVLVKHPTLGVELLFMSVNGKVETIAA